MTQKQIQPINHSKSVHNSAEILKKVTMSICAHLEKDEKDFNCNDSFAVLGLDEFDLIELVMKWEDSFGIIIEDSEVDSLLDVGSVVQFIQHSL